ncbi:MAG: phosphopantetheine-binding protein, partial [bacterium]
HDNFLDLGGHSLLALQMLARLRDRLQVEVSLQTLFDDPTISGLAAEIEQNVLQQEDDEKMAQMLAEIEQLSDAEAKKLFGNEA